MMINPDQLKEIALAALRISYQVHQRLGAEGEQSVKKNQFGETALKMDIEAEKVIIDTLRKAQVPIRIITEEHGVIEIGNNPEYLGILDGLDGSEVYKKKRGEGRYGTMLGIFSGIDPKYQDYIFSGIMEHSTRRLFYAVKRGGSFMELDGKPVRVHCSDCRELNERTRIYVDNSFDINRDIFSARLKEFQVRILGSSAAYYADLAEGSVDLVLECTRKGNLEIAVSYGLETESGGVMLTLDGQSLGTRHYSKFGRDIHVPVVSASTRELAEDLIKHVGQK